MASDPRRLRNWFLYAALAVGAVVLAALAYRHWTNGQQVTVRPQTLAGPVERATQGFSLSKAEGGHTLFTVRAAQAIEYKAGGRAHLHEVSIVVYGKQGDRYDQIAGDDFDYDPNSGDIQARGDVEIDLESNPTPTTGGGLPLPPREQKNLIHIKTSALDFNQKTGIASTDKKLEFRLPQATGTAVGGRWDSNAGRLTLFHQVTVDTVGDHPAHLMGESAVLTSKPKLTVVQQAQVSQPDRQVSADQMTAYINDQNKVERILAEGNVHSTARMENGAIYDSHAPEGELLFTSDGKVRQAIERNGATLDASGTHIAHGRAQTAVADFNDDQQVSKVHATGDVHLLQPPAPQRNGKSGQAVELISDVVDLYVANGLPNHGETDGAARIEIQPQPTVSAPHPGKTVITADKFTARFDQNGRVQAMHGEPNAKVVSPNPTPNQPPRVSTSQIVEASFTPAGEIESVVQRIHEHYDDGERQAFADQGRYTPGDQVLVLTGTPRMVQSDGNTTADVIRVNRATGEAFAEGDVKTTYESSQSNPNGAMLGSSSPVHVTAEHMHALKQSGQAIYTGHARLWQDGNILEAPQIEFFRDQKRMTASSDADQRVESVLVQNNGKGKPSPVYISAGSFSYDDNLRKARYEQDVKATGQDGATTAEAVDVYLKPRSEGGTASPGEVKPSQIDHMVAQGNVVLKQPGRTGTGEMLTYTDDDQKFVLTGTADEQPQVTDAQHGITRGDLLVFYRNDDRVRAESSSNTRAYTQTRVK